MSLKVEIKEHKGSIVFLLKGKLCNEGDSLRLNDLIEKEIEAGSHHIIFDLSDLKNCNSSGLNVLIRALTKTRTKNGDAIVCGVNDNLNKLFAITKLNEIFSLFTDQTEALKHFKQK